MTLKRTLFFGIVAGTTWSLVPAFFSELFHNLWQIPTVNMAGALTGVVVSLALYVPLQHAGLLQTLLLGIISLPLGGFIFGVVVTTIQYGVLKLTGIVFRFVGHGFDPIEIGLQYAVGAFIPFLAMGLVPLAILTTFWLRLEIQKEHASLEK